jgi:hypothetical protein
LLLDWVTANRDLFGTPSASASGDAG